MKYVKLKIEDADYEMLKKYAKAHRKYEVGKGYRIENVLQDVLDIGLLAIRETTIADEKGNPINWNE